MGASSSKSIIAPSGTAGFRAPEVPYGALLKVQERDNMAFGRIFKRMIENITPKELRELYSINQCKKYHFALGNALAKIFYFTPVQGMTKGAQPIYWLRLDSAKKEEYTPEFFKNCFQVAYFYIRLLQIFCALSISTKSNEVMPYSGGPYGGPMGQFFRMPGFSGGGERDDDDIHDVLRTYLDNDKFKGFLDRMKFIGNSVILEKQDVNIEAELSYDPKKERISIKNYTYNGRLMDEEIRNRYSALFYIGVKWVKDKGYYTKEGYQISATLYNRLLAIKDKFKETKEKKKGTDGEYVRGAPPAERRELRVEYLVDRLSGSANKPYAIARALQLIDLAPHETYTAFDPYGRGKKTYGFTTHVFDFNYSAIIGNAPAILSSQQLKDLQEQSNTLANVLGLSALEKLYFDKWDESSADGKGSESYRFKPTNDAEYQNFLKALGCMYESTSIVKKETTATSIRSFTIENVHKTEKGPKTLKIENEADKAKITALKKIQAQLFGLQMAHNARVKQFIQQFIIADTPRGPIPNPRIFREGISFINTIGVGARQLLLDYYVKAEAIYNQGYMLIKTGSMTSSNLYAECSKYMSNK